MSCPSYHLRRFIVSDDWCTPEWLTSALGLFGTDPASNNRSTVRATITYCADRGDDGLKGEWQGRVFLNPPYSKPLPWCNRLAAYENAWVALVKLDTTTKWWKALMSASPSWAPFRNRIKFVGPKGEQAGANFVSALVWKGGDPQHVAIIDALWPAVRPPRPTRSSWARKAA